MHVEHTTRIETSVATAWRALTQIERWTEDDSPFSAIKILDEGPLRVGTRARITMRGMPATAVWKILRLDEGRSLLTESRTIPGVTMTADHALLPDGDATRLTLAVDARGPLAALLAPILVRISRRNLPREAAGHKQRAEAQADING